MNIFDKTFKLLMEDLNPQQKALTDSYTNKRKKTLTFRTDVQRRTYIFSN